MKVITVVGTRPEIIKLCRVIPRLDAVMESHVLVHTGQNYDYTLNEVFFQELGIRRPDYFLDASGSTAMETVANILKGIEEVLEKEKPDAFLIYGDTNSCLSAIVAKRKHIPVFHMEAGNRCFDMRVPEELNRKIIDHISDINMVISEHARRYLLAEGIRGDRIVKVGSSMEEVFNYYMSNIENSDILQRENLVIGEYFLVSLHREENIDSEQNLLKLLDLVIGLRKNYNKRVLVTTHPRLAQRLHDFKMEKEGEIEFLKPFGFFDYNQLQRNAFCVVSDSGTISEESSLLGFPAVTIRLAHERPEAMDEGTVVMSDIDTGNFNEAIEFAVFYKKNNYRKVHDYQGGIVSDKVVNCILSYWKYIKRNTWFE